MLIVVSKFMLIPSDFQVCPPSIDWNAGVPNTKIVLSEAKIFAAISCDAFIGVPLMLGVMSIHVNPESGEW